MKLSTKSRYAVRALIDLITHYEGKPILIKDIAKRENISERYLENIFTQLRAGGILISMKGKNGGFLLAKDPKEITIYDIVKVIDGDIVLVECIMNVLFCDKAPNCVTRELWKSLSEKIKEELQKYTLQDLVDKKEIIENANKKSN